MYRRAGRGRLLLLVFLALSILVITLDFRQGPGGPLDRAKDISIAVVAPIQRGFTAVFRPVGNFFSSIGDLGNLQSENADLKQTIKDLQEKEAQAQAIIDENAHLRALAGLDASWVSAKTVTAAISGRVPSNYKWAYFINKGTADGVQANMAVVNAEGLVGKIVRADAHYSTLLLLIDPQGAAGARVEGGRDTGLIRGNGGNEDLSLDLIGTNSEIAVSAVVVTSGQDGVFPPGIPIGEVVRVGGAPAETQQTIDVNPNVDFTGLDFVKILIVTPSEAPKPKEGG
jgi:rod shape-determining protein MreC